MKHKGFIYSSNVNIGIRVSICMRLPIALSFLKVLIIIDLKEGITRIKYNIYYLKVMVRQIFSDMIVSHVSLGGCSAGGEYGPVEEQGSIDTVVQAVKCGINFLDTSPAYGCGRGEQVFGKVCNFIFQLFSENRLNMAPDHHSIVDYSVKGIIFCIEELEEIRWISSSYIVGKSEIC